MIRRVLGWAALVAGVSSLVTAAALAEPSTDVGAVPVAAPPASAPPPSVPPPASAAPPSAAPPATAAPSLPARWTPAAVRIDTVDVAAPVSAVGVTAGRRLDVPADPDRLGWWFGSALPGDRRGTVLIAGHVDTAEDGRGALFRLEEVPMGTRIEVRAGPRTVVYRVAARRSYAKTRLPADLFRRDTAPRLALITCGGAFSDGAYDRNVVVYATPV